MIQSVAHLLRWLAEKHADAGLTAIAGRIERAVATALTDPIVRTPDLGGRATTRDLTAAVVKALECARA
jgi:3-isopropylmalate dehydrogenase